MHNCWCTVFAIHALACCLLLANATAEARGGMPLCYQTKDARHSKLEGKWLSGPEVASTSNTPYWNLSCPLEWSKYSCVYQGESAHADAAARRHFVPNGCSLASPGPGDWEKVFTPGRTVYFVGDSLVRQVFIAMGCLLSQYLDLQANTSNLIQSWGNWKCGTTRNCLKHGVHSGFGENIRVVLKNGAAVQYLGDAKDLTGSGSHKGWKNNWALPSAGDAVVIELGVHSSPTQQAMRVTKTIESVINGYLLPLNVDVIWFATPPPSFHSKHGCYDFSKQNMGCANTAEGIRSKDEWSVFRDRNNSETFAQMRGMVELESIELQGDLKVGRGDCQHYCMPGPPDISAAAIFTMLMSSM